MGRVSIGVGLGFRVSGFQCSDPGGVDNIQDHRAITSVIRRWHVSRFNWVVAAAGLHSHGLGFRV